LPKAAPITGLVGQAGLAPGHEPCVHIENTDSPSDRGHAKAQLRRQWAMLKKDGPEEIAAVTAVEGHKAPALPVGEAIMRIDPDHIGPAEVKTLPDDKDRARPGDVPEITARQTGAGVLRSAGQHGMAQLANVGI